MANSYKYELTDTFGGESNYSWVKRGSVNAHSDLAAVRKVKKELGMSGLQCRRVDMGETIALYPYGICHVLFITPDYDDY